MRCAKCGAEQKEKEEFVGAFCKRCVEPKIRLKKRKVLECRACSKFKVFGEWKRSLKELYEKICSEIEKRHNVASVEYNEPSGKVVVVFDIGGANIRKAFPVEMEFKRTLCDRCYKSRSNYYEAIVQLRGTPSKVRYFSRKILREASRRTFVSKVEEKKEGADLYLGDSKVAFEIVNSLGFPYKKTRKLHTQVQGKRKYRITLLIRF